MIFDCIVFFIFLVMIFSWCWNELVKDHAEQREKDRRLRDRAYAVKNPRK